MKTVERILYFLFPTLRIIPAWKTSWKQQDEEIVTLATRVVLGIAVAVYLGHLVYLDSRMPLDPSKNWVGLRLAAIVSGLVLFACTYVPWVRFGLLLRVPILVAGVLGTWLQGISMIWHAEHPYLLSIAVPCITTVSARLSVPASLIVMIFTFSFEFSAWSNRTSEFAYILSSATVALVIVAAIRSRLAIEVSAFINRRRQLEAQAKLIEAEVEMNEQIRSFLPKEIYRRFELVKRHGQLTAMQAMDEVLKPRNEFVACLYTDIRNYTQISKNSPSFVSTEVIPTMRTSTDLVESFGGIPKLIGDLVFAYFDGKPKEGELFRAALCAIELASLDKATAQTANQNTVALKRYTLVSFGEATVGNLGGTQGAKDITVMGTPANILSRLDALTKNPKLMMRMRNSDVILTNNAATLLHEKIPELDMRLIDLSSMQISMRDFPEETLIWELPPSEQNRSILQQAISMTAREDAYLYFQKLNLFNKSDEALAA